jgi:hypothetical protein
MGRCKERYKEKNKKEVERARTKICTRNNCDKNEKDRKL